MNQVLARNIRTLLEKRRAEESKASVEQKMADSITRFTGSMPFVYLHTAFFGFWIVINLGWLAGCGLRPFDPSFVVLAMIASVESHISFDLHPHLPEPHECDVGEADGLGPAHQSVGRA